MMTSLGLLFDTKPNWFSLGQRFAHSFTGACLVLDDTATSDLTYDITIEEIGATVYARETAVGTLLPRTCYNRHIMDQGHFCLGLGYSSIVTDAANAKLWWESLSEFLRLQNIATATGRWPRHIELDHGMAGHYHRRALDAAKSLGCSEEYELALLGEPSWITAPAVKMSANFSALLNGRSPCPKGCQHNARPILRRDCCSKELIVELLGSERKRAMALEKFWAGIKADPTAQCCGTMLSCPLRKIEENE